MSAFLTRFWPSVLVGAVVIAVSLLAMKPYNYNMSALIHLDHTMADTRGVPSGFVVLEMPGYDGAQYYQIARNMPALIAGDWESLQSAPPTAYAYQRFLLPTVAFILSLGQERALPWVFFFINLASLIAACAVMIFKGHIKPLYALALSLSPAAMVGMHLSLSEPLTLLILTIFLVRYTRHEQLDAISIFTLCLLVLTREVNILFIALLGVYTLARMRWLDAVKLALPVAAFLALHGLIYAIFDRIPFLESTDKNGLPGYAIVEILSGAKGYNAYTLSSIALFLGFVLPGTIWAGWQTIKMLHTRRFEFLPLAAFAFFGLMWLMPDHIWSSITSIGRVITPVYPLAILLAARHDTRFTRILALSVLTLGLIAGVGLALIVHPFTLA